MSFDLLVFDKDTVPTDETDFHRWYHSLIKWDKQSKYNDLGQASAKLQKFYENLSKDFPPLNPLVKPTQRQSFLVHILAKFHPPYADTDRDFDEACYTDYSISSDAIYLCFAWSVSENALRATLDAAVAADVGFWFVSADGHSPLRSHTGLQDFRNRLGNPPKPKITKADLFALLRSEGWEVTRDPDDGSRSATLVDGNKIYRLYPSIKQDALIEWGESVVSTAYRQATRIIDKATKRTPAHDYDAFYPIALTQNRRIDRVASISHAKSELAQLVEDLKKTNLEEQLHEVASLPLSSPGNAPIRILAAKACLGEFFELCEIRDKMKAGNRQGFVPYITLEHLKNAVDVCAEIGNFP